MDSPYYWPPLFFSNLAKLTIGLSHRFLNLIMDNRIPRGKSLNRINLKSLLTHNNSYP
jgi:hypothetical protein